MCLPPILANNIVVEHNCLRYNGLLRSAGAAEGQPLYRILLVKGPRRNDDETCEGGAAECSEDAQSDVLENVADQDRDGLVVKRKKRLDNTDWMGREGDGGLNTHTDAIQKDHG